MLNTPNPANADETDVLETRASSTMAVFDTGFNELTPASFAFLAGANSVTIDKIVASLCRARSMTDQGPGLERVLKLVPTVDRDDRLGFSDMLPLLVASHRRIQGKVLQRAATSVGDQIAALVSFVWDCASAWVYSARLGAAIVIVELDDFCEYAGVDHIGFVIDELRAAATRLPLAVLAVAHLEARNLLTKNSRVQREVASKNAISSASEATISRSDECDFRNQSAKLDAAPNSPLTIIERVHRLRDPNARETIKEAIRARPGTPKELAERIAGHSATRQERARVRKLLQHLKEDGSVIEDNGRYRLN